MASLSIDGAWVAGVSGTTSRVADVLIRDRERTAELETLNTGNAA